MMVLAMSTSGWIISTFLAFAVLCTAAVENPYEKWSTRGQNNDLLKFVTRPDITAPKLETKTYSKDKTAEGYIFVAPYDCLSCGKEPGTSYIAQQIGPHIYAQDGELVWSGVDLFPNQKVFDFRSTVINGSPHLSLIVPPTNSAKFKGLHNTVFLDASYQPVTALTNLNPQAGLDIHELHVVDGGKTVLMGAYHFTQEQHNGWAGNLIDNVIVEIDLQTRKQTFSWAPKDHLTLSESTRPLPQDMKSVWDYLHLNSIDKDEDGDYLMSSRFTNTIYGISRDGSLRWRLGGLNSSFAQDFSFSRQHNAQFRGQNDTHTIISLFDNAKDDEGSAPTSSSSSLIVAALDMESMTATAVLRIPRPDGLYTEARGNTEFLANGNILGGWGENAYITEHSQANGELVFEARFASKRFTNYRAYKLDWLAKPIDKPVAKAFASTTSGGGQTTTIYVSWNGATEVVEWRCYSYDTNSGAEIATLVGSGRKTGFETAFAVKGHHLTVFIEAIDRYGTSLANSTQQTTELPIGFDDPDLRQDLPSPQSMPAPKSMPSPTNPDIYTQLAIAFVSGVAFTIFSTRFVNWKTIRSVLRGQSEWRMNGNAVSRSPLMSRQHGKSNSIQLELADTLRRHRASST